MESADIVTCSEMTSSGKWKEVTYRLPNKDINGIGVSAPELRHVSPW